MAHTLGHALGGDHRRGDHRIGRRQHGGEQEGLGNRELREEDEPDHGQDPQRDRHREHDCAGRRPPMHAQELALDDQAVGEQGQDQRQLDQMDDIRIGDVDRDHVGESERHTEADREHRDREHRSVHDAREPGGHRQQEPEEKQAFAEPEVHQDRLCAGAVRRIATRRPRGPARDRARPGARRPGRRSSPRPCAGCRRRSTC